jgi:hypothetical protein
MLSARRYKLDIYTSTAADPAIPNSYKIFTRQWGSGAWGNWTEVTVPGIEAARKTSGGYIKPSSLPDLRLNVVGSSLATYPLIFESKGSIVHVMNPNNGTAEAVGDTVVRIKTDKKTIDITVSVYGDVS